MASRKINFGIDLGTTNSALVKVDQGSVIIIKSELQKDTTPSCVSFTKKGGIRVGESALNGYRSDLRAALRKSEDSTTNTFIEFKRTMGTDKVYFSSHTNKSYSSEELSAEILKKLRTYVDNYAIETAIITVPAKFRQNQLDATQRAADLAGFKYVELLQEPIAASIAYGLEAKVLNGFWLVFDFGGGTFDAALMKVDDGIMKVIDTEGDNHLGGKNIDYQIVDEILLPFIRKEYKTSELEKDILKKTILRDALKSLAEEAKIQLSYRDSYEILTDEPICLDDNGEAIEVDMELKSENFNKVIEPSYRRSLDIVKQLLDRNDIKGEQLETIILVGGATYTKLIRELLSQEICPRIETNVDPMIAVAKGAALFASTRPIPISEYFPNTISSENLIQLEVIYPETTTELDIKVGIKVVNASGNYNCELVRSDGGWSTGNFALKAGKAITSLLLLNGVPNTFRIKLQSETGDIIKTDPDSFTVLQGLNIAPSTLPFSICVEAFSVKRRTSLLALLPGLEKNQQLPAKGKAVFFTPIDIHPGHCENQIDISIYEGEPETKAVYNEPIGHVIITGQNLEQFIPANQEIELTLEVDSSRRMKLSAYLPYIDETVEIKLPENKQREYDFDKIVSEINDAKNQLVLLGQEIKNDDKGKIKSLNSDLIKLHQLLNNSRGDYNSKTQVVERLREICIVIDHLRYQLEWPKVEESLRDAFDGMDESVNKYGDEGHRNLLQNLKMFANRALLAKDSFIAQEIINKVDALSHQLLIRNPLIWISTINDFEERFELYEWLDRNEAKRIIETAKANRDNKYEVMEAVNRLFALLPKDDAPISDDNKNIFGRTIWH